VIPKGLREKVMTMARDAVMNGHQGENFGGEDLELK